MTKVLNVAEKPSVARSISNILSSHCKSIPGMNKYCSNIHFETVLDGSEIEMIFTSVLGHLMELKFVETTKWNECDPYTLFDAATEKQVNPEYKKIAENIQKLSGKSSKVIVWTDCDREGENIASQIEKIVGKKVMRARFSGISRTEIQYALCNLVSINYLEAGAVDARMELDLRIGSAFTRLQTLIHNKGNVLSFGPCQIPTLNFVVERHKQIKEFFSEPFYTLVNTIGSKNEDKRSTFNWKRGDIFDRNCVIHFYNLLRTGAAKIVDKSVTKRDRYRPLPLRTVEFQKVCSSYYKIGAHRLMEIAEKLYNNGYISYPRTETDCFPRNFNFTEIIDKLNVDRVLGKYSKSFKFVYPRAGSNNDQAHSPIYPLMDGSRLEDEERKVFEFVARRFLGSVSENAHGLETEYTMCIEADKYSEMFVCKGLRIVERNYLDVYIYDKWEAKEVGNYDVNEKVENSLEMETGHTTSPEYLTESELIALMDKNGIGTDATIHEHIQKIQTRDYARKENNKIIPQPLGINLIEAYSAIGLKFYEPFLRKRLEDELKNICEGRKERRELVLEEISVYKEMYKRLEGSKSAFREIVGQHGADEAVLDESNEKSENKRNKRYKRDVENPDSKATRIGPFGEDSRTLCDCKKKARLLETKKGENSGRFFFACHEFPKKCQFFQWQGERAPAKREDGETVKCLCGFETQKKVASTENNRGREFFWCKKNYKKCKFFKWADE